MKSVLSQLCTDRKIFRKFTLIYLASKIILGISLCFTGRRAETLILTLGVTLFLVLCECVCLFSRWECIQVFLCVRLTTPGDKGVRFSNFLYCSKVKNCREKIGMNELSGRHSVFKNWHLYTHNSCIHSRTHTIKSSYFKTTLDERGTWGSTASTQQAHDDRKV